MIKLSKKGFFVCFVLVSLILLHSGCGRIMHFFNTPKPPQGEPDSLLFAGQISSVSVERYFILKDFGGYEWNIWVNEGTVFQTSPNLDVSKPIKLIEELLEKDTGKTPIRFEDLKPGDQCAVVGQIKKPAESGKTGEMLATYVTTINKNKLIPYSVFYNNTIKDPNMLDCTKVYPVNRMAGENATYEEILMLLFEGPTEEEKKQGYVSAIPDDVVINFIVRNDGIMQVDFKPFQIAGACATGAFAAQVKQTLLAIPGTKDVIISISGQTEGILQP